MLLPFYHCKMLNQYVQLQRAGRSLTDAAVSIQYLMRCSNTVDA